MDETRIYILFLKYRANRLSASEYEELKAWLSASAENEKAFERFLAIQKRNIQYEALSTVNADEAWNRHVQKRRFIHVRRWIFRAAVAALVAGCCWIGYHYTAPTRHHSEEHSLVELFPNRGSTKALLISDDGAILSQEDSVFTWFDKSGKELPEYYRLNYNEKILGSEHMNEVYVPRGGEYSLVLTDGTKVWLNAQSSLSFSYPFDTLRTVYLKGEAYFEVAYDAKKPFEVITEGHKLRVLGTKFNVRAYKEQAYQVTLEEGKVRVTNTDNSRTLFPGEQLQQVSGQDEYEVSSVDARLYSAWTKGIFEFDNATLEDILCQLERWYNVEVEYASDDLKTIRFTGSVLRKETLGCALEMIQKVSDVRFSKRGTHVLIERK